MKFVFAFVLAGLCVQEPDEFDKALKALSDNSIEARDQAQASLAAQGEKILPRLKKALDGADVDVKARLDLVIGAIERIQKERETDRVNRIKVLGGPAPEPKADQAAVEGAVFRFAPRAYEGGLVIETKDEADAGVVVEFDVAAVLEKDKELAVERCGRCSPTLVYVKSAGPVKARISGIRHWFSDYTVEFPSVHEGMERKVGDFTLKVAWPKVLITVPRDIPWWILRRTATTFTFKVKPGAVGRDGPMTGRFGGRFRDGLRVNPKGWCRCADGPAPVVKAEIPLGNRLEISPESADIDYDIGDIESISLKFLKPIQEPFEVTGPAVSAK